MSLRFIVISFAVTLSPTHGGLFGNKNAEPKTSVNHVRQDGFEHPNIHVHGFVLSDVFLHHATKSFSNTNNDVTLTHTLTQRTLQFNDNHHLDRHLTTNDLLANYEMFQNTEAEIKALDASNERNREKVRALAKINFINGQWEGMDDLYFYTEETLSQIKNPTTDLYFGQRTRDEMYNLTEALWKAVEAETRAVANDVGASFVRYDTPNTTNALGQSVGRFEIGVCALKFQRGSDTILVFRDTISRGDLANTNTYTVASVTDTHSELGTTRTMKRAWTDVAGLVWDETRRKREAVPDWYYRKMFNPVAYFANSLHTFPQRLVDVVNGQQIGGDGDEILLTVDEARKQAYWPVIKAMIDQVRKDSTENDDDGRILFSGYSAGGSMAQLARMYTEKKYEEKWPVISFNSLGASCFPRDLSGFFLTDYLDDVDPTRYYEHVTDYQLTFDFFGANVGPDVGDSCNLGGYEMAKNLTNSRQYRYCEKVWGYSAVRMFGDNNLGIEPLSSQFALCRFSTHGLAWVMEELAKDEELNEDGTTFSGCVSYEGASLDSGKCPITNTKFADMVVLFLSSIPIAAILGVRFMIGYFFVS